MKTALVFSGGGARGAYQIGVWKALDELNIKCDIVVGTSIGSINSALYCQGNYQLAEDLWKEIDFATVFESNNSNNSKKKDSIFSQQKRFGLEPKNLKENLDKYLNLDKIYNSKINCGMIITKFPSLKMLEICKEEIKKEEFVDHLIASSTVFPFFKLKKINNKKYIDGGLRKPLPISYAKKLGADKIIAVNISAVGKHIKVKEDKNTICIKPFSSVGNPLDFSKDNAIKILNYGYNDTMKKFKKLYGKKYTFKGFNKTNNELIDILDYLGTIFELDDSIIYTYNTFKEKLEIKINENNIINKKNIKTINRLYKYINKLKINKNYKNKTIEFKAALFIFKNIKKTN